MTFLNFTYIGMSPSGKTDVWMVYSGQLALGSVSWYAPWRKYAFHPSASTTWDANCLREIIGFLEDKTREHKGHRSRL